MKIEELKEKNENLAKALLRYKQAFNILIVYFDDLPNEEKTKIDKQLKKIGL